MSKTLLDHEIAGSSPFIFENVNVPPLSSTLNSQAFQNLHQNMLAEKPSHPVAV
jgi:hypothetical protein